MKKILRSTFFILLILSTFLCVSCSKTKDASDIYNDAFEKTESLGSFRAEMDTSVSVKSNDETIDTSTSMSIALDASDKNSIVYLSKYNIGGGSEGSYDIERYYKDGVLYENTPSGKFKSESTDEDITSQFSSIAVRFPKDTFKKSLIESKDGGYKVSAKVSPDSLESLLSSFAQGIGATFSPEDGKDAIEYDFSDADIAFETLESGYLSKTSVKFTANFKHSGGSASADITIDIRFVNPGETVVIEAPSNLDEYTEQSGAGSELDQQMQGELMDAVFAMYDENNKKLPNYDELYKEACQKYGKANVDSVVEVIDMFSVIAG